MSLPFAQSVHSTGRENAAQVGMELYGLAVSTYPCFFAGVNKFKEDKCLCATKQTENGGRDSMQQLQMVDADRLVAVLRLTENWQELAHAKALPLRVAGLTLMGYADIGGRCGLSVP